MKILYPLAILYGIITWLRNKLFDWGIFKEQSFNLKIIGIGNLSMGGSGKTPHTEYFITKLKEEYKLAIISRGYGRATKGFRYVDIIDSANTVGDEPLQIKQKFNQIIVAVCEKRVDAIAKIQVDHPDIDLILLDDAFQHRYVKPSLNILLTDYSLPFWEDFVLPAGRLREFRFGWRRADIILITKSPEINQISIPEKIKSKPIFFSKIKYLDPILISGIYSKKIILITGIANSLPLTNYLKNGNFEIIEHFDFPDHYNFTKNDISRILAKSNEFENIMILTTEKDWMRLKTELMNKVINISYIPIKIDLENAPENWFKFQGL